MRLENFTLEYYRGRRKDHQVLGDEFLTAHNFYVADTDNMMAKATIEEAASRLEQYCKANDKKFFTEAALDLTRAHRRNGLTLHAVNKKQLP